MGNSKLLRSFALLAACTALAAPMSARADDGAKTVEGTGEAAINGGDEPTAKDKAKKAALRDAVERTLGTFVQSGTQTKDFELVSNNVLSASAGYVSSYDVLDTKCDAGSCTVRVKAVVALSKISDDFKARGVLLQAMKFPRMAVLIAEQNIGQSSPSVWWGPQGGGQQGGSTFTTDERQVENLLIGQWTDAGFTFVDMDALAGKIKAANVVATDPSKIDPREIKNLSDADVIIVGTAIASKMGNLGDLLGDNKQGGTSMTSCKGAISARVFNADSGEILATVAKDKTALHIDPLVCGRTALQQAAKLFADELQAKLLKSWNSRQQGGSRIRMAVSGIDSLSALKSLKEVIGNIRGVQGVEHKNFSKGSADIDLRLDGGDVDGFASDLDGKTAGKFKVKVTGNTSNTITVELAR